LPKNVQNDWACFVLSNQRPHFKNKLLL
jgi:hypothetical protein